VVSGRKGETEMTRNDLLFKEEVIKMIKLWENESEKHREESQKRADELSVNDTLSVALKMIYSMDAFVQVRLQSLYVAVGSIMYVTNTLTSAIDKLPQRDEFSSVRDELQSAKKVIDEAVIPMKKLYEDAKDREKRGEGIND
jgi:hypothetical protein